LSVADGLGVLERYGVVILPLLMVAEQVGVPLPAVPALLGVGALAAHGRVNLALVLGVMVVVALIVDLAWYEVGRRQGAGVLARLCRLALEPDVCVRRTGNVFARYGIRTLLVAKFVPGLSTVTPPLAGVFAVPRGRFAGYDLAGVLLWAGTWLGLGYLFSEAISLVVARVAEFGRVLGVVVVVILAGYVGLKVLRRQRFLRTLRMARITPDELKRRLDQGELITIIDVRTPLDVAAMPYAVPGSRWIGADEVGEHAADLPRDRDLVLYCA
jgi:membrane protein DedA with SNARE-associated domain